MSEKKIQLVLDEQTLTTLNELRASTGAESIAHVLIDALAFYAELYRLLNKRELVLADRDRQELQVLNIPTVQGRVP